MKKNFVKMHGLGNDFAIFDGRRDGFILSGDQIRALGDRRRGIGYDQVAVIAAPAGPDADAYLHIYNADGQEIPCGNATRCVAALLMAGLKKNRVVADSKFGRLEAWNQDNKITVDMGPARLNWDEIPLQAEADTLSLDLEEGPLKNPVAVSMGNPHAVFFVDDAEAIPLETVGPKVEHHPVFPARTNVEAVQVLGKTRLRMRVWERGTGITQACGTGACAVAVAAMRRGLVEGRKATVVLDGGELEIEWREKDGHVLMTGDVALAFYGEVEL